MSRWLIILGVLGATTGATRAERVVNRPSVASQCAQALSWEKLKPCLQRFGTVTIEKSDATVKLVRITPQAGWPMPGLYVYAQNGAALRLAGMWQFASSASVEVISFAPLKVTGRTGFRLDLGASEPSSVSFDGETSVAATMQYRTSVFCMGPGYICAPAISSCDVFVGGKAYYTFRGTLKLAGPSVTVVGDRSRAGACATPESTPLTFDF